QWNNVHGGTLTRRRRPHYDIANVLETYQPRARTEGHLFQVCLPISLLQRAALISYEKITGTAKASIVPIPLNIGTRCALANAATILPYKLKFLYNSAQYGD
ncbi:unnamed protein product, partial [Heligmosomoides polygyrus]|uniref:Piwi domain-containing protein n=1 Tax=Heligmosomoides polygyrus TaxID=6339 RepID=A0A183F5A6_HELPZ